jgi:hypothetical protein
MFQAIRCRVLLVVNRSHASLHLNYLFRAGDAAASARKLVARNIGITVYTKDDRLLRFQVTTAASLKMDVF